MEAALAFRSSCERISISMGDISLLVSPVSVSIGLYSTDTDMPLIFFNEAFISPVASPLPAALLLLLLLLVDIRTMFEEASCCCCCSLAKALRDDEMNAPFVTVNAESDSDRNKGREMRIVV